MASLFSPKLQQALSKALDANDVLLWKKLQPYLGFIAIKKLTTSDEFFDFIHEEVVDLDLVPDQVEAMVTSEYPDEFSGDLAPVVTETFDNVNDWRIFSSVMPDDYIEYLRESGELDSWLQEKAEDESSEDNFDDDDDDDDYDDDDEDYNDEYGPYDHPLFDDNDGLQLEYQITAETESRAHVIMRLLTCRHNTTDGKSGFLQSCFSKNHHPYFSTYDRHYRRQFSTQSAYSDVDERLYSIYNGYSPLPFYNQWLSTKYFWSEYLEYNYKQAGWIEIFDKRIIADLREQYADLADVETYGARCASNVVKIVNLAGEDSPQVKLAFIKDYLANVKTDTPYKAKIPELFTGFVEQMVEAMWQFGYFTGGWAVCVGGNKHPNQKYPEFSWFDVRQYGNNDLLAGAAEEFNEGLELTFEQDSLPWLVYEGKVFRRYLASELATAKKSPKQELAKPELEATTGPTAKPTKKKGKTTAIKPDAFPIKSQPEHAYAWLESPGWLEVKTTRDCPQTRT